MRKFFNLMLQKREAEKVWGMYRIDQTNTAAAASFSFGITWAEIDKIVFDLYKLTSSGNNILFCSSGGPWIGYSSATAASFTFSGLTGSANLSPSEVTDGARHTVEFSVSSDSTKEITNTWDRSWAKQTGYIAVEFWKNGNLLKRFVPSVEDGTMSGSYLVTGYMVDTVSGGKIASTVTKHYRLEEIE